MNKLCKIRIALKRHNINHYVRVGSHTKLRLHNRGYTKNDITSVLTNQEATIVESSRGYNKKLEKDCPTYTILGKDSFFNPCVIVLSEEGEYQYSIVTIMPPMDKERFRECI